jgi:hypothetical protein
MAFPLSPVNGQIAVVNGIRYSYNSTIRSWTRLISSAKFTAAAGSPSEPALGDQWYDTNTDILYEWINDGYTGYWIDIQSLGQTGNIVSIVDSTLQGNIVVGSNTTYSIGASTGYLDSLYSSNVYSVALNSNSVNANTLQLPEFSATGNGNVIVNGNLIPGSNVTYSLGDTDKRFKDLYLSGNTIYLGGATINTDGSNVTITNPQGGSFDIVGSSSGSNNISYSNIAANVLTVGNAVISSEITSNGNLTFLGTARRITGDFSNATAHNRLIFQTSTVDANTNLNLAPNGAGSNVAIELDTDSSLTNSSIGSLKVVSASDVRIESGIRGSGNYLPITFYNGGSEKARIDPNGDTTLVGNLTLPGVTTSGKSTFNGQVIANNLVSTNATQPIQPITASVAANALTITLNPTSLNFRSATLGSGTVNTRTVDSAISVTVSSGSTLGTVNNTLSRLAVLALDSSGTVELGVVNLAGGNLLDETNLISTTAEGGAGAADSNNVVYSTTTRSNVAYRVVGFVESTQATAGTWATAPSTIQGVGGQALAAMSSLGYGQTWQDLTSSRALSTNYTNTTGRPIMVAFNLVNGSVQNTGARINVNGVAVGNSGDVNGQAGGAYGWICAIVPPGAVYNGVTVSAGTLQIWAELR